MLFNLFKSRERQVELGDYAIIKKEFENNFPNVSRGLVFKIQQVEHDKAIVVFINIEGTHVIKQALPLEVLQKAS